MSTKKSRHLRLEITVCLSLNSPLIRLITVKVVGDFNIFIQKGCYRMLSRSQNQENSLKHYCHSNLLLKSKIAILSFKEDNGSSSCWKEKLLLLYEYAQLISQSLLLYSGSLDSEQSLFERVILYFFKLINPSSLLEFKESSSLAWSIVILMITVTGLKYALIIYIMCLAHWNFKGPKILLLAWRWVFKVQVRFFCFFLTSFWVHTIVNIKNEGSEWVQANKIVIIVVLSLLIATEYLISFFIESQFCDMLPRKHFLSGKNSEMQMITLGQKMVLQIFQLCLNSHEEAGLWTYSLLNLMMSIWRIQRFFMKLPLYQSQALTLLGDLTGCVLALNFVSFVGVILKTCDAHQVTMQLIVILWIFMGVFGVRICRSILSKLIMDLFLNEKIRESPEFLLQKIAFSKQLSRVERLPGKETEKCHPSYLLQMTKKALCQKEESYNDEDIENLLMKHQKHRLIKLYIAKLWFKKYGLFSKPLKIIGEITRKPWSKEYTSCLFLLHNIRNAYFISENRQESFCDLLEYTENQKRLCDLKAEMIEQAGMKMTVCQNILSEVSDIGEIFNTAQLIYSSKVRIQKKIDIFMSQIPDYWLSPLLICSEYYLILEHSSSKCQKLQEIYTQKFLKYEKSFVSANMVRENIYQETNAFLILGGLKSESGIIKYCSKSIENICGGDSQSYISSHISGLFMPSMQLFYREFFYNILDQGDTSVLKKVHRTFLHDKRGFMFEADFCVGIHPYITENIYLNLIMRPVASTNEYLLMKENGDIEGATETISRSLSIRSSFLTPKSSINIKHLSEELSKVNQAFNRVQKHIENNEDIMKSKRLTPSKSCEAEDIELVNTFLSGREVKLLPLESSEIGIRYHCRIIKISGGSSFLKLIVLSKSSGREPLLEDSPGMDELSEGVEKETDREENYFMMTTQNDNFNTLCGDDGNQIFFTSVSPRQNLETEGNLLHSTTRHILQNGEMSPSSNPKKKFLRHNFTVLRDEKSKSKLNIKQDPNDLQDFISCSISSLKVSEAEEKQSYKSLKRALNKKTNSKFFKALCLAFYLVVTITLFCQLLLRAISLSTMEDLVIKKNLLNYAQTRSYYACKLPYAIEVTNLLSIGIDVSVYLPSIYIPPLQLLAIYKSYLVELSTANNNILKLLGHLDADVHEKVFKNDVRIFGSIYDIDDDSYINETSFQAVQSLGRPYDYLMSLDDPVEPKSAAAYQYIRRNSINDFLAKNQQITNIFQSSVNEQRDTLNFFVSLCLIISPLLLLGIGLLLSLIIWRHYSREKWYLKAFIKLHPGSVKLTLKNTEIFQQALVKEESFEDKEIIRKFWDQSMLLEEMNIHSSHYSKQDVQIISTKKTKKKYYLSVLQTGFYIGILIAVILWNFISSRQSLNKIYHKQSQLQLSNHLSERVSIITIGMVEMFMSNNTFNVSEIPALNHTMNSVTEITHMTAEVIEGFMELNGEYEPSIKEILFDGENCSVYGGFNTNYCNSLHQNGVLTDFVSLIAVFKESMEYQIRVFETIDRSSMLNLGISLYARSVIISPASSLLAFQATRLNSIINDQLAGCIDEAENKQTLIIIVFMVMFLLVNILIWIQILSKIKELNNDFKKVLQVLPPKLVLSSFLLKQFLNKVTTSILDK